jgi:hypothetical protein
VLLKAPPKRGAFSLLFRLLSCLPNPGDAGKFRENFKTGAES